MVDGANNQDNTETAGKLQKQQEAILKVIEANKYEPMRIPDGKKRELSRRIVRISTQTCLKVQHLTSFRYISTISRLRTLDGVKMLLLLLESDLTSSVLVMVRRSLDFYSKCQINTGTRGLG